jgi:hypothetical protein
MGRRRVRLGIRAQLTLMLLLGALLSTGATLFIANNAIQQYALQQTHTQEQENMKIAVLVLQTQYGQAVTVSSDGKLVTDNPAVNGRDFSSFASQNYGKYALNDNVDYVDQVQQLLGGFVSIYQCADAIGPTGECRRIATTLHSNVTNSTGAFTRETGSTLESSPAGSMGINSATPKEWLGVVSFGSQDYYTDYYPLFNPQQRIVGVLAVGVPLNTVTAFQRSTTIQLLLLGLIIMIAGVIFALLFAATIITTLQNVARQVSSASERISAIAAQQAGGSQQQVWAVNSISKALQNFAETTRDISHRTDQLAQMGNQVIQKRAEISPMQIDSILAYITRSVRDISAASRQEAQQYDRMTSAMQAVVEIAEQVASSSQQATDSAERLDEVIDELQQFVGVQRIRTTTPDMNMEGMEPELAGAMAGMGQVMSQPSMGNMNAMGGFNGNGMGQRGGFGAPAPMGNTIRSDHNMRMPAGQYMGRMPAPNEMGAFGGPGGGSTSGQLGQMGPMGQPMGQMGPMGQPMRPMGGQMGQMGPMSQQMRPMGQMGQQMGQPMRPMGGQMGQVSDNLPPLGIGGGAPMENNSFGMMNPASGPMDSGPFGGRRSYGGDGGGEMSMPMPPLPDFQPGSYAAQSRSDMSAPPATRTRGMRGPVSGPRPNGNGNSAATHSRMPDWPAEQDYEQRSGR